MPYYFTYECLIIKVCGLVQTRDAIGVFITSRRAKGLSKETLRWYTGILKAFENACPQLPEEPEPIQEFLAGIKTGDERLHGYYRAIRAFYNYIDRRLHAFPNPMVFIDPPKRKKKNPRPITPEELDQLLSYPHNAKVKASLIFLTDTGVRMSEALGLQMEDFIEMPWGYFAKVTGKTGERFVPVSSEAYRSILEIVPLNYSKWWFSRLISRAFKEARVSGSGINLRHTFGSMWRGDITILQQIMGHSHISTTLMYRHLCNEYVAEQHRQFTPLKSIYGMTRRLLI